MSAEVADRSRDCVGQHDLSLRLRPSILQYNNVTSAAAITRLCDCKQRIRFQPQRRTLVTQRGGNLSPASSNFYPQEAP